MTPEFNPDITAYTAETTNSTTAITATAPQSVNIAIRFGGNDIASGDRVTWNAGENVVTITATAGTVSKTYTVTVTKT